MKCLKKCLKLWNHYKVSGGHGVPEDKIRSRYKKALELIPELVEVVDIMHIYDNSTIPHRIFKKRKSEYFVWENENFNKQDIEKITGKELNP